MATIIIGSIVSFIALLLIRGKKLDLLNWTFFFIFLYYGLLYVIVITWSAEGYCDADDYRFLKGYEDIGVQFKYLLCCIAMLAGFYMAFYVLPQPKYGFINYKNKLYLQNDDKFWKQLTNYSILILVVSIVSYYLYAKAYGGFVGLLSHTMMIRVGLVDVANPWSFLQRFGSFSFISSYCLFSVMLNKNVVPSTRKLATFSWIISFIFSFFVAISYGGRGVVLNMLLIYMLTLVFAKSNSISSILFKHWFKILIAIVGFILTSLFWRGEIDSPKTFIAVGYSYLFNSFTTSLNNDNYLYFVEVLIWPLFFLPQSLYMGKGFVTTNMYNTYLMQGGFKGDVVYGVTITGECTTGFLSFSYYQLGIVGVFLFSIVIGFCIKKWNNRLKIMPPSPFRNLIYAYYVIQFVYYFIGSGTVYNFIVSNFAYFVFFLFFPVYRKCFK